MTTTGSGTSDETVIDVSGLRMRYGAFEAVRGIDLHVTRGEVVAFLGPNGAGKTTTVEILEGYRPRTGGTVTVLGRDPWRGGPSWRARIGVVLQESEPERDLTAAECLHLYAGYYPAPRDVGETLELAGLSGQADVIASLAAALLAAYNPHTTGAGFARTDLLVVALWGAGGLAIALRRFSWVPRSR